MDSNHDKELQRLLCYHYTTGQDATKLAEVGDKRKGKTPGKNAAGAVRGANSELYDPRNAA